MRRLAALAGLLLCCAAAPASAQGDSTAVNDAPFAVISAPQFRLMERVSFPGELIRDAVWLDERHYLCLSAGPAGAQAWLCNYDTGERSLFITREFFNEHVCQFPDCLSIDWSISPSRHYLFLRWNDSTAARHWLLLDISDPPFFVSRSFEPPDGMHVSDVLFSMDDRYGIFTNDAFTEGSDVSLLVLDLQAGSEAWRISTHDLSFVEHVWWDDNEFTPHCYASAQLSNGEFQELPGLAVIDIPNRTLSFDSSRKGQLLGDSADWGSIACFSTDDPEKAPWYIRADMPGFGENMQVPLSDAPQDIRCLEQPGLILLRNTINYSVSQLWLIDLLSGDKLLVSRDCERFAVGPRGSLLVVPRGVNELNVMKLFLPDEQTAQ